MTHKQFLCGFIAIIIFLLSPLVSAQQIVVDFQDSVWNNVIENRAKDKCGVNLALNSAFSDEENIFIGAGSEPELECLKGAFPSGFIESIEPNYTYTSLGKPNDPLYQFQWNLDQINAEKAWEKSCGKGVVVAVIDTGVAIGRDGVKDLSGTEHVPGYDFVQDDAVSRDLHGHGTHVAGTVAQTTNNKYGVSGVAHCATIMPIRVLDSRGSGQVADIAEGIRFAADNGAHVINMSLGGPYKSAVISKAILYARNKNVVVVAAAGNDGRRSPSYPAGDEGVIAVAATRYDKETTFYSTIGDFVDIAAPGGDTSVDQNGDGRPDGVLQETVRQGRPGEHSFQLFQGTSMASPHVAGVAALVIEAIGVKKYKVEQVEAAMLNTATKDNPKGWSEKEYKDRYGNGIVDAAAAVKSACSNTNSACEEFSVTTTAPRYWSGPSVSAMNIGEIKTFGLVERFGKDFERLGFLVALIFLSFVTGTISGRGLWGISNAGLFTLGAVITSTGFFTLSPILPGWLTQPLPATLVDGALFLDGFSGVVLFLAVMSGAIPVMLTWSAWWLVQNREGRGLWDFMSGFWVGLSAWVLWVLYSVGGLVLGHWFSSVIAFVAGSFAMLILLPVVNRRREE